MGKNLADLQSNISISATNAVTGDIEWCTGYTQFSTDIGEQAGWYLALQVTPDVEDATVTAAYNGTIRTLSNNIYIIRLADGEDTITFTAEKEGYTTGRLTLNLSGLEKELITNSTYVRSLTNGITVTPLEFGDSKSLSGVVPYDTTTSSNKLRLTFRTFNLIPAGSEISVAHQGTSVGSGTFYVYTPQEGHGEPYSAAEIDITLTQAILDSGSPTLNVTISPLNGAVSDRFYCSLGVENLTLEPAPAPEINVTSLNASIKPATANTSKTATGELLFESSFIGTNSEYRLALRVEGNNYLSQSSYTINVYNENDLSNPVGTYTNQRIKNSHENINVPVANLIGTSQYLTITFSPADYGPITLDISNLTLQRKIFIDPVGITYQGHTYTASDFISGGTFTRTASRRMTLDGATFKWCDINSTDYEHYLAFTVNRGATTGNYGYNIYMVDSTGNYEVLVGPTNYSQATAPPTTFLIHFTGSTVPSSIVFRGLNRTGSQYEDFEITLTNCTFEAAPLGPLERNVFELSGSKTVDGVTYTNDDLITGGTLTRQTNQNRQYVDNVHFKWNSDLIEDIWDIAGYGIILTSVDPSYAEWYQRAEAISSFKMDVRTNFRILPNTETNIEYTIPHTYFLKIIQNSPQYYGVSFKLANSDIGGQFPISFRNCTWEADPRSSLSISYSWLQEGNYNNIAITNYFTPSTTSLYDKVTFINQNGYYGFLKIKGIPTNGVVRLGIGTYEDVTNDITGITLASDERILKFDATSITDTQASLAVGAPGYKPYSNTIFLTERWVTQTYSNGLTDRNINISPLSSTVKAAGFGDYCDINFTPIEAATATVVNDEINVTVTGTINKKSTQTIVGQSLTDYQPIYKNWSNSYSTIDSKNEMYIDANKHFLIFEVSTLVFPQIVNNKQWKCKGFTSTQTSLVQLKAPVTLNQTSLTTIWAIPIEEGMTSVSIQAVGNDSAMTTVTYNFDLTNVTYGTISE